MYKGELASIVISLCSLWVRISENKKHDFIIKTLCAQTVKKGVNSYISVMQTHMYIGSVKIKCSEINRIYSSTVRRFYYSYSK